MITPTNRCPKMGMISVIRRIQGTNHLTCRGEAKQTNKQKQDYFWIVILTFFLKIM